MCRRAKHGCASNLLLLLSHSGRTAQLAGRGFVPNPVARNEIFSDRWITGEDRDQISLALTGFSPEEITITADQSTLVVEGRKDNKGDHDYLYQGISTRPFRRAFNLAEYVQVKDATLQNGMLKIALVREVPEAMKPRRIAIEVAGNQNQQIEQKQAA